ncbi:RES family NAD+ phosphorylase [Spartinivicinus poritis]|uniref:RES family NAD+ phosphorylase n=1 Tax=Spartinivicinus poritis TaxID=2994640 RepID=A0ABT5UG39_9GAMM|nr:RES family NAD+ phosphorylase [Spartinivicinus sp. A2-2]MDE1465348.1 RES family NAD+ phosphorylase [Spartinivicinus sp. A2-2]
MLKGWRIAAPEYSKTPQEMLSGEGAFLFGGRWNSKGTRVVYLAESLALASMELLVHLKQSDILKQYHKLSVSFNESLVMDLDTDSLPSNWQSYEMEPDTQATGDYWVHNKLSLLLRVPSVTVPEESNYILNPEHPDLDKLDISEIVDFGFDSRLVKK